MIERLRKMKKSNLFTKLFELTLVLLLIYILEIVIFRWQPNIKIFIALTVIVCLSVYLKNYFLVKEVKDNSNISGMFLFYTVSYFLTLLLVTSVFRGQNVTIKPNNNTINLLPVSNTINDIKLVVATKNLRLLNTIVCNVLMFVPFAYLLPRIKKSINMPMAIAIILALSSILECCQFIFEIGVLDIDDIILNTFGAAILYPLLNKSKVAKIIDKFFLFKTETFSFMDYLLAFIVIVAMVLLFINLILSYWQLN